METKRKKYELLRSQLENDFQSFKPYWRDLGEHILPSRPRFTISEGNRGDRRNQKIIDSTATLSARNLRSGMMSGVTSPARPWFRVTTPEPGLAEKGSVKHWLHQVGQRMATAFLKSNLYNALPIVYGDLGVFGTAALYIEEDLEEVFRCQVLPIGTYRIAKDYRGKVNILFREFQMTARQLIEQFGIMGPDGNPDWSNFSLAVKSAWERGETETKFDVCHVILPNHEHDPRKLHSKFKKYISCYYEKGMGDAGREDTYLRESGFDYFPVLVPRWETTGEDVYGTDCPGMTALGDIKALQLMQKRKSQAIEKKVNPPMIAPNSLRTSKTSILPGDITYSDLESNKGFRPAHEVTLSISELSQDIMEHQRRIQRCFFEDLFMMLANDTRSNITAREIEERHEEKLLALGPVLEQLNQDLLDPLIDIVFDLMAQQGHIPEPPEEIQGMPLKIEYISVMAQAQKLAGIGGHERFLQTVIQLASIDPSGRAVKKVNFDQYVDVTGDMLSVDPSIIRDDEELDAILAEEAKAAQAQQMAEAIPAMTGAAKDLGSIPMEGDTALTRMMDQVQAGSLIQ